MLLGTIIGWDKSFRRQETEDTGVPLPHTPPLLVLYFYHMLLRYGGGLSLLLIAIGSVSVLVLGYLYIIS